MRPSTVRSQLSSFSFIFRQTLIKLNYEQILTVESKKNVSLYHRTQLRWRSGKAVELRPLVIPVPVNCGGSNVGVELTGELNKDDILKVINQFLKEPEVIDAAAELGLDSTLFNKAAISFRNFCMNIELPEELHVKLSDILKRAEDAVHIHDILPWFKSHAREIFPHLRCQKELKELSDIHNLATSYTAARNIKRKLIFHAGPTNSGKTSQALERFTNSKSGVYCSPLKLLSVEVFNKMNLDEKKFTCDLVTGEERHVSGANHVACTIEMVSVEKKYEVAIIDEIQMLKDPGRGWAWTRALLGLAAEEIHMCGEEAAIDLVKEIARSCGEEVQVIKHHRKSELSIEDNALEDLNNVQPGDCIVCFNKQDIFKVSSELEKKGFECAVIYGGLPPGTKLAQAKKFNDPDHDCKILVATDAIGMGLNLSIRRVIFYSLEKIAKNENGEKEMMTISTSQALQIGGRAGRFNTQFPKGFVTTFRSQDLSVLKNIMSKNVEKLTKAGFYPSAEQIEIFSYNLPGATMSYVIDSIVHMCNMETSPYFMCDTEGFKYLADKIEHIPLPLRDRYVFCCAPINRKHRFVCVMFVNFARQYSENNPLTIEELCKHINWPCSAPQNIGQLDDLEAVFDVLELYLWLSYRFSDYFPHVQKVQEIQKELDEIIQQGILNITHLKGIKKTDGLEEKVVNKRLSNQTKHVPSVSTGSINKVETIKESSHVKFGSSQKLISEGKVSPKKKLTKLTSKPLSCRHKTKKNRSECSS